jgi:hypothetical protein
MEERRLFGAEKVYGARSYLYTPSAVALVVSGTNAASGLRWGRECKAFGTSGLMAAPLVARLFVYFDPWRSFNEKSRQGDLS